MLLWENTSRILTWNARNTSPCAARVGTPFTKTGHIGGLRIPPSHSWRASKALSGQSIEVQIWKEGWIVGNHPQVRSDSLFYSESPMALFFYYYLLFLTPSPPLPWSKEKQKAVSGFPFHFLRQTLILLVALKVK